MCWEGSHFVRLWESGLLVRDGSSSDLNMSLQAQKSSIWVKREEAELYLMKGRLRPCMIVTEFSLFIDVIQNLQSCTASCQRPILGVENVKTPCCAGNTCCAQCTLKLSNLGHTLILFVYSLFARSRCANFAELSSRQEHSLHYVVLKQSLETTRPL